MSGSFKKCDRLLKRSQFLTVQNSGLVAKTKVGLVIARPNGLSHCRLGVTVSKRVHKRAVIRNRIKRYAREVFRSNVAPSFSGLDLVYIARSSAIEKDYHEFSSAFERPFLTRFFDKGIGQSCGK